MSMAPKSALMVCEVLEELTWGVGKGADKQLYMLLSEVGAK